jgi:hypothetical protein
MYGMGGLGISLFSKTFFCFSEFQKIIFLDFLKRMAMGGSKTI